MNKVYILWCHDMQYKFRSIQGIYLSEKQAEKDRVKFYGTVNYQDSRICFSIEQQYLNTDGYYD